MKTVASHTRMTTVTTEAMPMIRIAVRARATRSSGTRSSRCADAALKSTGMGSTTAAMRLSPRLVASVRLRAGMSPRSRCSVA